MFLITEQNFNNIEYLTESDQKTGEKRFFINGVFMQANVENRNGRIYEDKVLKPVVDKYIKEQVKTGSAFGELNHPQSASINLDRVSHRITELKWDGDNIIGKALIVNTPTGQIARGLMEGGGRLGVSSRGTGSLKKVNEKTYVDGDYALSTVDIVADPSAPNAFVNGILEGVEFLFDSEGKLVQKHVEIFEEKMVKRIDEKATLKALDKFLQSLS
jgi:hypothetical protein